VGLFARRHHRRSPHFLGALLDEVRSSYTTYCINVMPAPLPPPSPPCLHTHMHMHTVRARCCMALKPTSYVWRHGLMHIIDPSGHLIHLYTHVFGL
jgi:hypothetical protein